MSLKVWLPFLGNSDNIGASNIAITTTNVGFNSNGKLGQCAVATSTVNLNIPQSIYDVYTVTGTEISYAMWFKIDKEYLNQLISTTDFSTKTQIYNKLIGFYAGTTSNGVSIHLRTDSGLTSSTVLDQIYIYSWLRNGSTSTGSAVQTINLDEWYHVAVTYDATNRLKFYINGSLIDSRTVTRAKINTAITSQHVGLNLPYCQLSNSQASEVHLFSLKEYFNDVRVYDHALSTAEVHELAQGMVRHYKMDDANPNPNLLPDSNAPSLSKLYASYARYWESSSNGTYTCIFEELSDPPVSGIKYGVREKVTVASGSHHMTWYSGGMVPVTIGSTYTMSCYVKNISGESNLAFKFQIGDGQYSATSITLESDKKWHQYSWTFTPNSTNSTSNKTRIYCGGLASVGEVLICGYKLEEGDKATPWVPHVSEPLNAVLTNNMVLDSSGYGKHGTIVGTTTIDSTSPRYLSATHMNAKSTSNHIEAESLPSTTQTISLWIKSTTEDAPVIFSDPLSEICLCLHSSGDYAAVQRATSSKTCYSLSNYSTSNWNHMVITKNGTQYGLWVNGVQASANGSNYWQHNANLLWLFNRSNNNTYASDASISDFRAYTTLLSVDDIKELYRVGLKIDNRSGMHTYELQETQNQLRPTSQGLLQCEHLEEDEKASFFNDKHIEAAQIIEI